MSKTRLSTKESMYVIGDIHGLLPQLNLILKRILPLRKNDKLILLGDYIDRGEFSYEVIERLIRLKEQYSEQMVFLMGNHEFMFYDAIQPETSFENYRRWMKNGGYFTLCSYMKQNKIKETDPWCISRNRIIQLIPESHIEFVSSLLPYYETDHHIFVHAGCDPYIPADQQDQRFMLWDRTFYNNISENSKTKQSWKKCIITGHNGKREKPPLITEKYWMIDGSIELKIHLFDANNHEIYYTAEHNNKRLVKSKVKNA